jgi:hypothetical protein
MLAQLVRLLLFTNQQETKKILNNLRRFAQNANLSQICAKRYGRDAYIWNNISGIDVANLLERIGNSS